ncbi:MAG: hypothetical protein CMH85_17055 [Novosphingobium sp.]|nr:hypothetical protein [Novosphingobium sp.]
MVAKFAGIGETLEKRSDNAITAVTGYFLLASGTILLTSNGTNHATMWPADALILALLLKNDRASWPAVLMAGWMANLLANAVTRDWAPGLIVYGGINMGQTLLAAVLICRTGRCDNLLADIGTVLRFVLYAGVIAPLLGALAGTLATALIFGEPVLSSFVRWYISNALGFLILTPFLMALFDGSYVRCFKERTPASRLEVIGLHALHIALTGTVFAQNVVPMLFLPVSTALILAFRLGRLGVIVGTLAIAIIGAAATYMGHGPVSLVRGGVEVQEFVFQFYIAVVLATTLPVAATVSSRAEALKNLAEREEALRLMMAHSPDGILSFDATGVCRWADGPLAAYLGVDAGAMIGKPLDALALRAPGLASRIIERKDALSDTPTIFEFSPVLRPHLTLEASLAAPQQNGSAVGTVVTLRDVTKRKAKEVAMRSKVHGDDLTGLLNRAGFRKKLRTALLDEGRPATLALVDVDCFRSINETYGHGVGDTVLAEIAKRLQAATRADDIVARMGGDEFAILLRCDLETAMRVCQRMVEAVRETSVVNDGVVSVLASISCGIAAYGGNMERDDVFDAADAALQEAKRRGRGGVRVAA